MERRLSERVQFFQVPSADEVIPVWVFQRAHAASIPGLLLDVSADGVQILTDKSAPLPVDDFQLIIHADDVAAANLTIATVRRLWSQPEGTLYIRNGCLFEPSEQLAPQIDAIRAAREAGKQWFRCELVPI